MASRVGTAVLFFGMISASLAGCIGGNADGKSFDAIPAPAWSAGNVWRYAAHEGIVNGGTDLGGASHAQDKEITFEVFNTTEPLAGEAVYYLHASDTLDNPMFQSTLFALRQRDLSFAGGGDDRAYGVPQPLMVGPDGMPADTYRDPCAGRGTITPATGSMIFPRPAFPLTRDQNARGQWIMGEEGGPALQWSLKTHGLQSIQVPAGRFDAVLVSLEMTPGLQFPNVGGGQAPQFRIHADYYYAPAVQNYVKTVMTATVSGMEGPGTFDYGSTAELTSFDLASKAATPAPMTQQLASAVPRMAVVSDTTFPLNVADGPKAATFALRPGAPNGPLGAASALSGSDPIDPAQYEIVWSATNGMERLTGTGATFTPSLDRPGVYSVTAMPRPRVCGVAWVPSAYAAAPTQWTKTWTRHVDAGLAGLVPLGPLGVGDGDSQYTAKATWTMTTPAGVYQDGGSPRLVDEDGIAYPPAAKGPTSATFYLTRPIASIAWQREGAGFGAAAVPVSPGGDLALTLTIAGPDWMSRH